MGTCCTSTPETSTDENDGESITQKADSMQQVLPNIYMGSAVAAKNKELLLSNGVTHVIAIGWNLEKHYEDEFKYLLINRIEDSPECIILNQFEKCFHFMDECFNSNNGKLFVHCHKGLSRSATVVIAYEMFQTKTDFDTVLAKIRENRSFIMPNIGFQAQLDEFYNQNYSLNMEKYKDFDVILFIKNRLPYMNKRIKYNYNAYKENEDEVDENELFELTLYTHQVHKLKQKDKLNPNDINILTNNIEALRNIQVKFVKNESSIKRFDIMFRTTKYVTNHTIIDCNNNNNNYNNNNNNNNNESQKLISTS